MRAGWRSPTSTNEITESLPEDSSRAMAPSMSSARRSGVVGWSVITASKVAPADSRRRTTSWITSIVCAASPARSGGRMNGTSSPHSRPTCAISSSSVDNTTRVRRTEARAASAV
jgi:hypothetical protein